MLENIESIFAILGALVAAATAIVAALDLIAKVTPTTKDDAFDTSGSSGIF